MDAVFLARIQFAMTVGFHFIFPAITIGLAWLLVVVEWRGWRRNDPDYQRLGRFFARLFALSFAVGVATGIVMEFQFGTNWAEYSKFVGDIFGAPLAAEGIFAFFLESVFLGVYLFARERISRFWHWFSILMVAVGATLSAFWIIVANSWQQTPAGYRIIDGRAELTDFMAAVFNPSTIQRYTHTVTACLVTGGFFMLGICAWLVLKRPELRAARKGLAVSAVFSFVFSLAALFPTGHESAKQVARTQPEKFAAIEGLYLGHASRAPMIVLARPRRDLPQPRWEPLFEIQGLLSWMAFGDWDAPVQGIEDFPPDEVPPLIITFATFHTMVALGLLFIAMTAWALWGLWRGTIWRQRWFLWSLVIALPLPNLACQIGWMTAEIGRQPWIVYRQMKVSDAISQSVDAGTIVFSILLLGSIYVLLFSFYLFVLLREVRHALKPGVLDEAPSGGAASEVGAEG